jgi:AcrR family transcriptional regulator
VTKKCYAVPYRGVGRCHDRGVADWLIRAIYNPLVTEPPVHEAIDPWRQVADEHHGRRYQLFMLAMPVFAEHGFRGATIRELAHACHLSPAGLYHYFRSKAELATYALRSPRAGWDRTYIDPSTDPLLQLRAMLALSIQQLPTYMLSLRMLEEIGDPGADRLKSATFRDGEQMIARFISAVAPALARDDAEETSRLLIAVLVGSALAGLDDDTSAIRRRLLELLRARLVPDHLAAARFEDAFTGWAKRDSKRSAMDSVA